MLNLPLAPLWAKLLQIPRPYLYAGILFFASLGAYSVNFQAFDLALLLVFGLLGLAMRRFGLPVLPLIIGVILGPRLEEQLTEALAISAGRRQHAVGRARRRSSCTSSWPSPSLVWSSTAAAPAHTEPSPQQQPRRR